MELAHCKWDAQVGDVSTLTPFPLLIAEAEWQRLARLAEALAAETMKLEHALVERPELHRTIALPRPLRDLFVRGRPTPGAARAMRFDFHWTTEGWRISEVNSDVPGGFTEATSFTRLVQAHVPEARLAGDPAAALASSLGRHDGSIALMNAPGHMEDHQVVAFLAKLLGERARVVAPSSVRWKRGAAHIEGAPVGAIYRFYQAEWLAQLPASVEWRPLFVDGATPVANPGLAALSESKRLPLVWDRLGVPVPTWRELLPETRALEDAPWSKDDGWLIKSAYSNTGDTVTVREAPTWRRRAILARLRSGQWLAQRRFEVIPLEDPASASAFYPCIGVYAIDGVAAGAYARISSSPVIDAYARDVALLVVP